jgi:hypothetical protein
MDSTRYRTLYDVFDTVLAGSNRASTRLGRAKRCRARIDSATCLVGSINGFDDLDIAQCIDAINSWLSLAKYGLR